MSTLRWEESVKTDRLLNSVVWVVIILIHACMLLLLQQNMRSVHIPQEDKAVFVAFVEAEGIQGESSSDGSPSGGSAAAIPLASSHSETKTDAPSTIAQAKKVIRRATSVVQHQQTRTQERLAAVTSKPVPSSFEEVVVTDKSVPVENVTSSSKQSSDTNEKNQSKLLDSPSDAAGSRTGGNGTSIGTAGGSGSSGQSSGKDGTGQAGGGKGTGGNGSGQQGSGSGPVSLPGSQVRFRHRAVPVYPQEAQDRGYQGQVRVQVVISTNGELKRVSIQRSSGFRILDEAGLQAARSSTFMPHVVDGEPREVKAVIGYPFVLR